MSLGGRNSEQRHDRYSGKCNACHDRKLEGHDNSAGERCSVGSANQSRMSSHDSGPNLISRKLLKKHKAAPRSEIGLNQSKISKSVNRQMKRPRQMAMRQMRMHVLARRWCLGLVIRVDVRSV